MTNETKAAPATVMRRLAEYHAAHAKEAGWEPCGCPCPCTFPMSRPEEIANGECSECKHGRHVEPVPGVWP